MNCEQTKELLPLYAGRDLEKKRATLVTEHLQTCAACALVADQYRESVHWTEQFAPPVFNDAVFAGIRQRVLSEIETNAMSRASSRRIASLFQPRLTWAIASVLLAVVSLFAIYIIVNSGNDKQQLARTPPAKLLAGTNERFNSGMQSDKPADLQSSLNTGAKDQRLAGIRQHERKRSRGRLADHLNTVGATSRDGMSTANNASSQTGTLPGPTLFPPHDSAALVNTLRVEIQTPDPKIRIIWFVPQETKPVIPTSKGS